MFSGSARVARLSLLDYRAPMKLLVFGLGLFGAAYRAAFAAFGRAGDRDRPQPRQGRRAGAGGNHGAGVLSGHVDAEIADDIAASDAILVSIPPGESGDPVLASFADRIAAAPNLRWIGYLSTVGVYGDHAGDWVDETTPLGAGKQRSQNRVTAEQDWLALGAATIAVQIFRLSGIYGPGRNQLAQLASGTARRIVKPGQIFNRIHVADIAAVIEASLARPRPGGIYNVTDNEPAPPQDVVAFAARLCGLEPPPEIPVRTRRAVADGARASTARTGGCGTL